MNTHTHIDKTHGNKSISKTNDNPKSRNNDESIFQFTNNRPEAVTQRKIQSFANQSAANNKQIAPSSTPVIQKAGNENTNSVNTKSEFRQTTTNFFGIRGSDHELDTVDGFLDEYHEIMNSSPESNASKNEKQRFSDTKFQKLDDIEQQLRNWLQRKKKEPNNKYRDGVRNLLSQIRQTQKNQKTAAEKEDLEVPLSTFEKRLLKSSSNKTPSWKRKARAKSSKAKKRQQIAIEKEERKRRIIGTILRGMMLTSGAIDTYNTIQQGPRFSSGNNHQLGSKKNNGKDLEQLKLPSSNSSDTNLPLVESTGHGHVINSTGTIDMFNMHPMSMASNEMAHGTSGIHLSEIPNIEKTIHSYQNKSLTNTDRVNSDIQQGLLFGASTARVNSGHGQKPLLGHLHVNNTLSTLKGIGNEEHESFVRLYNQAGHQGTDKELDSHSISTQQSLLLKALGARKSALTSDSPDIKANAMQELHEFATNIRSTPRDSLIKQTTPYDVDERHSDSHIAPSSIEKMNIDGQLTHDRFTENDGLFQHYTMSCGPTSFMMAKAEADPIYAMKLQDEEFNKAEQHRILTSVGNGSSTRVAKQNYKLLEQTVKVNDSTSGHELLKYANSTLTDLPSSGYQELETIRQANNGWPTDLQLDQMRSHNMTLGEIGTDKDEHAGIVTREVGEHTGLEYERVMSSPKTKGEMIQEINELNLSRSERRKHIIGIDAKIAAHQPNLIYRVVKAVKEGHIVPINIPSHTMSVVDAKESESGYSLLIHDPWTGKSLWFKESELFKGKKIATEFGMPASNDRFINDFVLPK